MAITAVGLPSEVFAEFGMEIKAKLPFKNTISTGYETTPGSTYYEIGWGKKLAASAMNQLKKIF
jgi:neutral ceramidase